MAKVNIRVRLTCPQCGHKVRLKPIDAPIYLDIEEDGKLNCWKETLIAGRYFLTPSINLPVYICTQCRLKDKLIPMQLTEFIPVENDNDEN